MERFPFMSLFICEYSEAGGALIHPLAMEGGRTGLQSGGGEVWGEVVGTGSEDASCRMKAVMHNAITNSLDNGIAKSNSLMMIWFKISIRFRYLLSSHYFCNFYRNIKFFCGTPPFRGTSLCSRPSPRMYKNPRWKSALFLNFCDEITWRAAHAQRSKRHFYNFFALKKKVWRLG